MSVWNASVRDGDWVQSSQGIQNLSEAGGFAYGPTKLSVCHGTELESTVELDKRRERMDSILSSPRNGMPRTNYEYRSASQNVCQLYASV